MEDILSYFCGSFIKILGSVGFFSIYPRPVPKDGLRIFLSVMDITNRFFFLIYLYLNINDKDKNINIIGFFDFIIKNSGDN